MKHLDNLIKEDLDTLISEMLWSINEQEELFDYDKKEMIEYVIKKLKEEK